MAKKVVSAGAKEVRVRGLAKPSSASRVASGDILGGPKGKRRVSHRRIAAAVEKVFRDRTGADA